MVRKRPPSFDERGKIFFSGLKDAVACVKNLATPTL
jgi:hypothetical protein